MDSAIAVSLESLEEGMGGFLGKERAALRLLARPIWTPVIVLVEGGQSRVPKRATEQVNEPGRPPRL